MKYRVRDVNSREAEMAMAAVDPPSTAIRRTQPAHALAHALLHALLAACLARTLVFRELPSVLYDTPNSGHQLFLLMRNGHRM